LDNQYVIQLAGGVQKIILRESQPHKIRHQPGAASLGLRDFGWRLMPTLRSKRFFCSDPRVRPWVGVRLGAPRQQTTVFLGRLEPAALA
jgi:hypothetical protein